MKFNVNLKIYIFRIDWLKISTISYFAVAMIFYIKVHKYQDELKLPAVRGFVHKEF